MEWGRGKCASLYTESSDRDGLVVVWGVSVDTTIINTFLSAPARTACNDMVHFVYSKELERDVTTSAMAKAILRLKTLVFIHSKNIRRTNKGCHVHAMCKMLLFLAKSGKTSAYFLRVDIKLKKSRSEFDLVTVLVSKQSFF